HHDKWNRIRKAESLLGRHRLELYRHDRAGRDDLLLRHNGRGFWRYGKLVFQRSPSHHSLSSRAEQLHFLAEVLAGRDRGPVKPPPIGIGPDQNLRQQRTQSVNRDVPSGGLPEGHEGLVPLIQASLGDGNHQSGQSPAKTPTRTPSANSMEDRDAE